MFNWTLPQIGITTAMTIYWGDPLFTRKVVNICMQTTFATWKVTLVFLTYFWRGDQIWASSNLESAIFAGPPNQAWLSTVWTLIKIRQNTLVTMWIYKRVLLYATASKKLHSLLPQFSLISTIKFAAFCSSKVSRQASKRYCNHFFFKVQISKEVDGIPLSLSAFVLENWPVSLTHIHCDDEV